MRQSGADMFIDQAGRDTESEGDFFVRVTTEPMHLERQSASIGQLVEGFGDDTQPIASNRCLLWCCDRNGDKFWNVARITVTRFQSQASRAVQRQVAHNLENERYRMADRLRAVIVLGDADKCFLNHVLGAVAAADYGRCQFDQCGAIGQKSARVFVPGGQIGFPDKTANRQIKSQETSWFLAGAKAGLD
jgi:hypothetical protein